MSCSQKAQNKDEDQPSNPCLDRRKDDASAAYHGHRSGIHNESCNTKEEERTCESDERKRSSCRRDSHISYRARRDPTTIPRHILQSAIVIACMIREATAKDATDLCVEGAATAKDVNRDYELPTDWHKGDFSTTFR